MYGKRPTFQKKKRTYRKKATPTRYKKRRYYRKTTKSFSAPTIAKPKVSIQRGYLPFSPAGYWCRLPYSNETYITVDSGSSTAGTGVTQTYSLNSLHDPDVTGIGKQPMQWDQLNTIYNGYLVHAAKIKIEFTNPDSDGMYVGYRVRSGYNTVASGGQTIAYFKEMDNTKLVPINNSGKQTASMSVYVPLHSLLGLTKEQYKSNFLTYGAYPANTSPGAGAYLDVVAYCTISGTTTSIRHSVKIIYYSQLSNYITQAQS